MADKPFPGKRRRGESAKEYAARKRKWDKKFNSGGGGSSKARGGRGPIRTPRQYGDTGGNPLGVGWDYKAQRSERRFTPGPKNGRRGGKHEMDPEEWQVDPRYWSGATVEIFGSMGVNDLLPLQVDLARLGLMSEDSIGAGLNGSNKPAFERMLSEANAQGVPWQRWIRERIKELDDAGIDSLAGLGSEGAEGPAPLTVTLSNPDDIRAEVKIRSTQMLGGNYAGDPEQYVREVQEGERKQQTDQYNQTLGAGGTNVQAPTVESLILKKKPLDYGVEQLGQNAQQIIGLLQQTEAGR